MRLVQFLLLVCLTSTCASHLHRAAIKKNSRSSIDTPDSTTETPDSSPETPNSESETPETPDTPDTTQEVPDTAETPDSKAVVPNSANTHSSEIDIDDGNFESDHTNFPGHVHDKSPGRLVIKGKNSTHFV